MIYLGYQNALGGVSSSGGQSPVFYPLVAITRNGLQDQTRIYNAAGALYVDTQGLVLPYLSSAPTGYPGMIYYNTGSNTVKLYNGSGWTDIGTGTGNGSGSTYWKAAGSGIQYTGDAATITNGTGAGYQSAGSQTTIPSGAVKLPCDTTVGQDCGSFYPSSNLGSNTAYDMYQVSNNNKASLLAVGTYSTYYQIYNYTAGSPNTASLNAGTVNVVGAVSAGSLTVGGQPVPMRGTICGLYFPPVSGYGAFSIPCGTGNQGPGPELGRNCPSGYSDVRFGKGAFGNDVEVCSKQ